MRDINKMREHIEEATWGRRERRPSQPASKPNPSPRAWRAPDAVPRPASTAEREVHRRFEGTANTLTARSIKVTVPLNVAEVAALEVPESASRIQLTIAVEGGALRTEVSAKSMRKVQRTIAENGSDGIFCQLVGKLMKNEIVEAGLIAQAKAASK